MKRVLLISPAGQRWIAEGEPFRFLENEKVAEDEKGNSIIDFGAADNFKDIIVKEGLLIGNVIKKVTSALGIKQCMKCQKRQLRYNEKGLEIQEKIKGFFRL